MFVQTALIATTVLLSSGTSDVRATGFGSTPMFLRGQPVWVERISRRQLLQKHRLQEIAEPERTGTLV